MRSNILNNRIAKNAGWIIGAKVVQALFGFAISILSARYLGPSNYGIINYAASLISFVTPFAQLGITDIIVQELISHKDEEGTVLGTATVLTLFSSVICILGLNLFALVANADSVVTRIVCLLYSLMLICQAFELILNWFQAHLLSKYTSIISTIAYIVVSAYKLFLLMTQKSIYWFTVSYSIDFVIIASCSYLVYKKKGGQRFSFSKSVGKRMLNTSKYYIVSSLMVTLFVNVDKIMINQMIDDASVGFYSVAISCSGMTGFIFSAVINSFRPVIFSHRTDNNIERFELNLKRLYCIVIYLSLAQSVVVSIFSKEIVSILYGSQYIDSIGVLKLLVWYTTFSYLGSVRNIWILSENKQKYLLVLNSVGAVVNIILNAVLIPRIGITGAALASLVTQFITNYVMGWILKPLRHNNKLMMQALNPRCIIEA